MKTPHNKFYKAQLFVFRTAQGFEVLIAGIVIIAILITFVSIPDQLLSLYYNGGFNDFLKTTFNVIIGIELLKMLCRHDLDSVVEVLLFAVARELIIAHHPITQTFIGILAIAVLFLIRKYLFVSALDKLPEEDQSKN